MESCWELDAVSVKAVTHISDSAESMTSRFESELTKHLTLPSQSTAATTLGINEKSYCAAVSDGIVSGLTRWIDLPIVELSPDGVRVRIESSVYATRARKRRRRRCALWD